MSRKKYTVIFDDTCNLCNASVRLIIRNDPQKKFRFTGLETGYSLALKKEFSIKEFSSVALQENGNLYFKSSAILRIFKRLRFPWPLLYFFIMVPVPIRDFVYDFISKKREKWFGRSKTCEVCKSEDNKRFVGY
jgi:predicted DCC family thiol-disulfide oxidoreductase YuxK